MMIKGTISNTIRRLYATLNPHCTRKTVAIAILLIAIVVGAFILRSRDHFLDIEYAIEYRKYDPKPLAFEVTPDGQILTIQRRGKTFDIKEFGADGRPLWLKQIPGEATRNSEAVIILVDSFNPFYAHLTESWLLSNMFVISVSKSGLVSYKKLHDKLNGMAPATDVVPTRDCIYIAGETERDVISVAIRMDYAGIRRWKRVEPNLGGNHGSATVDCKGNLIMNGDIGAGVGPFIVKYSPDGKLVWKRETEMLDGSMAISIKANKHGRIHTIFRLDRGVMTQSGDDVSGRRQDFVLFTYSSNGKLMHQTILSHGAWLYFCDSAINKSGEVIAVGNRRRTDWQGHPGKHENAQLVKCDIDGNVVWSYAVKLPSGCVVRNIKLDEKGGIFLLGYREAKSDMEAFIYKIKDPR